MHRFYNYQGLIRSSTITSGERENNPHYQASTPPPAFRISAILSVVPSV